VLAVSSPFSVRGLFQLRFSAGLEPRFLIRRSL